MMEMNQVKKCSSIHHDRESQKLDVMLFGRVNSVIISSMNINTNTAQDYMCDSENIG